MALHLNKWNKYKSLAFIRLVSLKFTLLCQEDVFYTYSAGIQYTLHVDSQHFHTHLFMHMLSLLTTTAVLCSGPLTAVLSMHHQTDSFWVIYTFSLLRATSIAEHTRYVWPSALTTERLHVLCYRLIGVNQMGYPTEIVWVMLAASGTPEYSCI